MSTIPIPRIRDRLPVVLAIQAVLKDGRLTVIDERKRETVYVCEEFESDFGRGYRLLKADGEVYNVNVGASVRETWCSCIGFERYGLCKHVTVCRELLARVQPGDDPDQPTLAGEPS
jgi:hypothetical protein